MAEKKAPIEIKKDKQKKKKEKRPRRGWRIFKISLLVFFLIILVGGGVAGVIVMNFINDAPELDTSRLATVETSYLYDRHGAEITALHEEQNRVVVPLSEIPGHVQEAFIAIEDERFYNHFGFDIVGSVRAAFANLQAGSIVQGASTISQQLAQNAFLTTETSYERKVQEIWLAIQMERTFVKDEILEMYLNRIYFGNGAYGVEAAAQTYFGKNINDVNLSEAAMLAGAVRSPNFYNPFDNEPAARGRMELVLSSMKRLEFITEEEFEQARNAKMAYSTRISMEEYPYPHFVDYVVHHELIRLLSSIPSIGSREEAYRAIYTGGLRIFTTLDPHMQLHVEDVLGQNELYPTTIYVDMAAAKEAIAELPANRDLSSSQLQELIDEENGLAQPQAAIVLADPNTGQILALGGGREYRKRFDEVLRFNTLRQPGSAIKPIITYGPAFEEGALAGAGSTLDDSPYIGPRENWFPENFDYNFRGFIPARDALYFSYNIPAVRAFEMLGPRVGADYAERMGISTLSDIEKDNLSLTLGGMTHGVSAIDMAQAYGTLANEGVRINMHTVERIEDRFGEVLYEYRSDPQQVISPAAAYIVSDILQDFVTKYLGRALQIDRPVAAKTGTTDDWKDVYLVAYTPNLVASFWMGYDEPKMGRIQQGWRYSTAFLREVFLEAFEDLEIAEFVRPEGVVSATVCTRSGLLASDGCRAAGTVRSDFFMAQYVPGESCNMHGPGGSYNRPPYIITDERWSSRGGPGRGPDDAEEMRLGDLGHGFMGSIGQTTDVITSFHAYFVEGEVTLQWQYDGPMASSFNISRTTPFGGEGDFNTEVDRNSRQFGDGNVEEGKMYTYTISVNYPDGSQSETASVSVNTAQAGGGFFSEPSTIGPRDPSVPEGMARVPNLYGSFQGTAEMRLNRENLVTGTVTERYTHDIPRGRVIAQEPSADSIVEIGTPVNLVISLGVE